MQDARPGTLGQLLRTTLLVVAVLDVNEGKRLAVPIQAGLEHELIAWRVRWLIVRETGNGSNR